MTRIRLMVAIAMYCAASAAWVPIAFSQTAGDAAKAPTPGSPAKTGATAKTVTTTGGGASREPGNSLTDSPYEKGAPPITGGTTDTSQGGTKTSGDPLAAPPGVPKGPAETGK